MRTDKSDPVGLFPKPLNAADYAVLLKSDFLLVRVGEQLRGKGELDASEMEKLTQPRTLRMTDHRGSVFFAPCPSTQ